MAETKTHSLFRDILRSNGFYSKNYIVEEDISDNPRIKKLLKNASKSGDGSGKPDFIISFKDHDDLIMVVECKEEISKHESENQDKFKDYAVDGVLLYQSYLSKEFDVISVAFSGNKKNLTRTSIFLNLKKDNNFTNFKFQKITKVTEMLNSYIYSEERKSREYRNILNFSGILNTFLHKNKIQEDKRSLLFSGVLIALYNRAFKSAYLKHKSPKNLINALISAIYDELSASNMASTNLDVIKNSFSFLKTHPTLNKNKDFLITLINEIDDKINNYLKTYEYHDILGEFYIEFLKYANNDKGLGIVLTPPHITDLFTELAGIDENSVVYDNCCGTGGFLISAMKKMLKTIKTKKDADRIKKNNLIGVEFQDNIFSLALSNMIIHGDGKTRIINEDCFDITEQIKKLKPNVGLLNPPYKSDDDDIEELEFVLNNLECLTPGGICVAIIPVSCVNDDGQKTRSLKELVMSNHTLLAVMSMPQDLFHNSKVGVTTCIVVFKAHEKHPKNFETFLGYWREDLFEKRKNLGRIDVGLWENVRSNWLNAYKNKKVKDGNVKLKDISTIGSDGYSILKALEPKDEWCIENYLETDYSDLNEKDFESVIKSYLAFKITDK